MVYYCGMKINSQLAKYLEKILGSPVDLRPLPDSRLSGLPVFLTSDYRFQEWRWLNQIMILANAESGGDGPSAADLRSVHQLLSKHFNGPVVFVYPAMDAYRRNRLVQLGLPFIVPGLQLFIPPFASLTEQFQRTTKPMKLSTAAQVTVLFQLYRSPADGFLLNRWAELLGYSAMTMTKVRDELIVHGLCKREEGAKPRGLRFQLQKRALWEAARPFLLSPVKQTNWVRPQLRPGEFPLAGLTALSKLSLVEDDALPTYACYLKDWKRLAVMKSGLEICHAEEASARIECWRYDPRRLTEANTVDRLSLFLSLANSPDERVRLAANSLVEEMPW